MNFKTLKEKGEYYRSLTDYRLLPNSYAIIMLDGRSFSHKIKNKFNKPFDDDFVRMMNETTKYLCENIQGALFGYCQSDEIHIVLSDFVKRYTITECGNMMFCNDKDGISSAFFQYRISKIQSIVASMATSKFNQLMMDYRIANLDVESGCAGDVIQDCRDAVMGPLYEFDCKVWNVPNANEAFAWLLYRQIDCIRNSKQQLAQTYLPHKELAGKHTDEQIALLKEKKHIDWHLFPDGLKNGRMVYKGEIEYVNDEGKPYVRSKWLIEPCRMFTENEPGYINIAEVINGRVFEYKIK